jgi:antitoxin Phd
MANPDSHTGIWQLHEAKARFSELFRLAHTDGPQRVTRHGGEAVVIVRAEQFDQLEERTTQPTSLVEFFHSAPLGGATLDLRRKRDSTRNIKW